MKLLIAVINDPDYISDILDEFLDAGVLGATVLDSTGMGHLMAERIPFFSRFAEMGQGGAQNKTIFVILKEDEDREKAIKAIEKVIGDLDRPDTGVVFTLPVDYCKGLTTEEENTKI